MFQESLIVILEEIEYFILHHYKEIIFKNISTFKLRLSKVT